jgi:exodeoxyribonuclease VII small subunit
MTKESPKNFDKKISKMSFEDALARLEEIVEILSSQKINLDSMIDLHEEGSALKEHCAKRLEEAQMKIETVSKKPKSES